MPRIERFDPTIHDAERYIRQGGADERRARSFLVLNSLMTKAIVESVDVIRNMPADEITRIELYGDPPEIAKPYHFRRSPDRIRGVGTVDLQDHLEIDKYYMSHTVGISGIGGFQVPVGQYGPRLAYATVQAARATAGLFERVSQTHPAIMQHSRQYNLALALTFQKRIKGALLEGIQTLAGQFGLLAMAKVPGYNDPMALFDAFRRDGTLNAWAAHAEFGNTAPQFNGRHLAIAHPTQVVEGALGDRVKLTDAAKENLRSVGSEVDGCPVARRNTPIIRDGQREIVSDTGINLLAGLFGLYLKHYYNAQHNEEERQKLTATERFVPVIAF